MCYFQNKPSFQVVYYTYQKIIQETITETPKFSGRMIKIQCCGTGKQTLICPSVYDWRFAKYACISLKISARVAKNVSNIVHNYRYHRWIHNGDIVHQIFVYT